MTIFHSGYTSKRERVAAYATRPLLCQKLFRLFHLFEVDVGYVVFAVGLAGTGL